MLSKRLYNRGGLQYLDMQSKPGSGSGTAAFQNARVVGGRDDHHAFKFQYWVLDCLQKMARTIDDSECSQVNFSSKNKLQNQNLTQITFSETGWLVSEAILLKHLSTMTFTMKESQIPNLFEGL